MFWVKFCCSRGERRESRRRRQWHLGQLFVTESKSLVLSTSLLLSTILSLSVTVPLLLLLSFFFLILDRRHCWVLYICNLQHVTDLSGRETLVRITGKLSFVDLSNLIPLIDCFIMPWSSLNSLVSVRWFVFIFFTLYLMNSLENCFATVIYDV